MKMDQAHMRGIIRRLMGLVGLGLLTTLPCRAATIIDITNSGFEDPALANELNNSFDGVHGPGGVVPGWSSNEPSSGGVIRVEQWFPGRTGNNVMYLHGSTSQNFYTAGFDLGTELQSHASYTLSFDVLRWYGWDGVTSITQDNYITFQAGLYTGDSYENRVALAEASYTEFYLLDNLNNPLDVATVTLTFTTGDVAPGTTFWIGGNANGNASDGHRTHYDNFQLSVEAIPEPSTAVLLTLGVAGLLLNKRRRA